MAGFFYQNSSMAIEKITGIVTDVLKYSDRHNVVTLFTRERGRVAVLSAAGNSKTARVRNASLMPLSVISSDVNFSASRELQYLGTFQREKLWKDMYFNPVKSAICLFLAEFLNTYVRQSGPDDALWDFCIRAIESLDNAGAGLANYHLAFLIEFLVYAGIRPDLSEYRADSWFDMRGGTMTALPPAHRDSVAPGRVMLLPLLARMNLRTARYFRFNGAQRRELLEWLLRYYSLHFPGMAGLRSPEILGEVFG